MFAGVLRLCLMGLFWVCSLLFGEFSRWWFGLLVAGGFAFAFGGFGGCLCYCFDL